MRIEIYYRSSQKISIMYRKYIFSAINKFRISSRKTMTAPQSIIPIYSMYDIGLYS